MNALGGNRTKILLGADPPLDQGAIGAIMLRGSCGSPWLLWLSVACSLGSATSATELMAHVGHS